MSNPVGAIVEYILAGVLLGFAIPYVRQKSWGVVVTAVAAGAVVAFLGLDLLFGWIQWS